MGKMAEDAKDKLTRDRAALYALLDNWRGRLEEQARQNAPWKDRTGSSGARQALHAGIDRHKTHYVLYLAHGKKYGVFLELGTGIHGPERRPFTIVPKNKKALAWGPKGKKIFAKKVVNPGMKARPIIVPTLDANIKKITRDVRELFGG